MKETVGVIGLGKLGLPVATCLALVYDVVGFDVRRDRMSKEDFKEIEKGPDGKGDFTQWLRDSTLQFASSIQELLYQCRIVFVAIQTPHDPMYGGTKRFNRSQKRDFSYTYLKNCVTEISKHCNHDHIVVIISTVLPGTMRREVFPILDGKCSYVYNPFFIAMGTVMRDFTHPEFVLLGGDDNAVWSVEKMYAEYYHGIGVPIPPFKKMSVPSAELTKVAYNTFISLKIAFVNTLMEICHKTGANVDSVTSALCSAHDRLISGKYLTAGMGDGGGCHPRDNIALSWLSDQLNLSFDMFGAAMMARELQAEWLVKMMVENVTDARSKCYIFGYSFKPETNLIDGSPALLCAELLRERGIEPVLFDPHIDKQHPEMECGVYLIGTRHPEFRSYCFPLDSVVIDPHRFVNNGMRYRVIRVGEAQQ